MTQTKMVSAALAAIIVAGGMAMAVLQEQPELALIKGGTWATIGITLVVSFAKDLLSSMRDSRK